MRAGEADRVRGVRGVIAEKIVVSTRADPFLNLRALAEYSCISVRSLRDYLIDPAHPLPCYRIGGKVLVRRSEFDAWAGQFRRVGLGMLSNDETDRILRSTAG